MAHFAHNIVFRVLSDTLHYINLKSLFKFVSILIWIARIHNCSSTNSFGVHHENVIASDRTTCQQSGENDLAIC